ncbi:hypothetical protein NPX13_g6447 [Xylaria arbuscula]|uniref:Uncharacterized protein n=1 Tax=Xylaria arbuscula TaxID=114810 RepID=A0A9W8NCV4_9PEZI|nr:hypothetical protein NPX13_g6447 [Xylaria arbuscula]
MTNNIPLGGLPATPHIEVCVNEMAGDKTLITGKCVSMQLRSSNTTTLGEAVSIDIKFPGRGNTDQDPCLGPPMIGPVQMEAILCDVLCKNDACLVADQGADVLIGVYYNTVIQRLSSNAFVYNQPC